MKSFGGFCTAVSHLDTPLSSSFSAVLRLAIEDVLLLPDQLPRRTSLVHEDDHLLIERHDMEAGLLVQIRHALNDKAADNETLRGGRTGGSPWRTAKGGFTRGSAIVFAAFVPTGTNNTGIGRMME